MKINHIDLGKHPILLAPMEDVTDPAFRLMCKKFGADMVYTEFVSSDALIRAVSKTAQKLNISDEERPVAIQIYGKDTETMVEAAKIVEQAQPDILDINFGCPVKRVAGKGAGAGMLQNIPQMLEITRAVVDAVKIPVTVKTRLGWDANNKIIVELAEQLQDCELFSEQMPEKPEKYMLREKKRIFDLRKLRSAMELRFLQKIEKAKGWCYPIQWDLI